MHGLVVIEGMTLSGHPWIINEILQCTYLGIEFQKMTDRTALTNDVQIYV